MPNADRHALAAWSSNATGAPNTAMIPSPVNLSTVPPYRCTTAAERSTSSVMISRSRSGPTAAAMSIECTTSANSTVTCLYSAGVVGASTGAPQEWQNRALASGSVPQLRHAVAAVICHSADLGSELARSAKNKLAGRYDTATRGAGAGGSERSVQPLVEELDHALARLVRRVAVLLTHLVGQHRMRHPRKAMLVSRRRVDLDDLKGVTESLPQRLESLGRH